MTNAEARFNKSHIRKVYACLAVTCHLHLNAYNNVRDVLYNNDVITNTVKSVVHSPVGKLV